MPLCASESLDKLWPTSRGGDQWLRSSEKLLTSSQEIARPGGSGGGSSDSSSPPSPMSVSPPPRVASYHSMSTSLPRSAASSRCPSPCSPAAATPTPPPPPQSSLVVRIVAWYPRLVLRFVTNLLASLVFLTWSQVLLVGPTLWLSAWLWVSWKVIQFPLTVTKWVLTVLHTPASERARKKRTVLISGGSTIQALHLARNFYSAGARVVVCEVEGLFGLARFSTAVHKFYTIPRPNNEQPQNYVKSLCDIVQKENAAYYIPVCSSTMAYYDGLAKPHLEVLNCTCFCPGVQEIWALDDFLDLLRRCQGIAMATPVYYPLSSREELVKLYDSGLLRTGRHFMVNAGPAACRERLQIGLPPQKHELRLSHEVSEQKPWVVVQDLAGEHYVTCTTVKESQVVANVTCRVDKGNGGLVPVDHTDISRWLKHFFNKCRVFRHMTGHVSFRFVVSDSSSTIVPLGCRVGVSMPYICYTSVHPRIVWKPCRHFSRQSSGPLVADSGLYWMHEAVMNTLKHPSVEAVGRLIGTVLDKREALFVFWDPLPYCAYYHLQLPFKNVLGFVRGRYGKSRRNSFHRTMASPAH